MYTALSIFRRMAKRLGGLNRTRPADPDSRAAAGASKAQRRAGVAAQVRRSPLKWQVHAQAAQTPSNLM
jgi:hypothetical protein